MLLRRRVALPKRRRREGASGRRGGFAPDRALAALALPERALAERALADWALARHAARPGTGPRAAELRAAGRDAYGQALGIFPVY